MVTFTLNTQYKLNIKNKATFFDMKHVLTMTILSNNVQRKCYESSESEK